MSQLNHGMRINDSFSVYNDTLNICNPIVIFVLYQVGADGTLELSAAALQRRGVDLAQGGFTTVSVVASSAGAVYLRSRLSCHGLTCFVSNKCRFQANIPFL